MNIKITSTVPEFNTDVNAKPLTSALTEFTDIVASGDMGPIASDKWKMDELQKLFAGMTAEEKRALFIHLVEAMDGSEGWFVDDIAYLKNICGIESFQATFS